MSRIIKCVVWDLDNTLWDGVCLEGEVRLRSDSSRAVVEFDDRGILNSIASRGVEDVSMNVLKNNGLDKFFLAPRVNWLPKPMNIIAISEELGVSFDAMAFVDDDAFEREQVAFMLPDVMVLEDRWVEEFIGWPEFTPGELTREARFRRRFYQAEQERRAAANRFADRTMFLKSCRLRLTVRPMTDADIPRVMELMSRTHQLNTTGRILPRDDLLRILTNMAVSREAHVADLEDRFGSYGTIGAAIINREQSSWRLSYLAVSCRVLGRGVERAFVATLLGGAAGRGCGQAEAEFRSTGKNREMRALYQMMGFKTTGETSDGTLVFRRNLEDVPVAPPWIEVMP